MILMPYNKTQTMFGALRATSSLETEEARREARALLIVDLRGLFDGKPVDEAIVAYVTDVALPRELYADGMRRRVTPEDVAALLTYRLGYFAMDEPHHYAMVRTWWGARNAKILVCDSIGWAGQPEIQAVTVWYERFVMPRKGIAFIELTAWTNEEGLDGYLEMEDGEVFECGDIIDSPAVHGDDEFEQFMMTWCEHARFGDDGPYVWDAATYDLAQRQSGKTAAEDAEAEAEGEHT